MATPSDLIVPLTFVVTARVALRYGSDALLRLVAGITAIAAGDTKRSRAERALDVLRALRGDRTDPAEGDGLPQLPTLPRGRGLDGLAA